MKHLQAHRQKYLRSHEQAYRKKPIIRCEFRLLLIRQHIYYIRNTTTSIQEFLHMNLLISSVSNLYKVEQARFQLIQDDTFQLNNLYDMSSIASCPNRAFKVDYSN